MNTFLHIHGIGKRRFDAVRLAYLTLGLHERIHGNSKRLPHHGFTTAELQLVVLFLKNYSEENPILLPGRVPGYKRTDLQLLPTNTTKKQVWEYYIKACGTRSQRIAGYRSFCILWQRYVPHILITMPRTDLCWTCQENSRAITLSSNRPDEEKARVKLLCDFNSKLTRYILDTGECSSTSPAGPD